jgi:recombination associated protein RdgC
LSTAERQQAYEAAQQRADREARAGAHRRMKACPVLIDLAEGTVYFASLGTGAGDKFVELFSQTFGVGLTAGTTPEIAHRLADADGLARALADVRPAYFVEALDRGDGGGLAAYGQLDRSFLGREFLTWLWYHVDAGEGVFRERGRADLVVSLEKIMHLRCGFAQTGDSTIRTDAPAGAPESRAALEIGKQPTKAGLLVSTNGDGWALMLDALRFNVSGLTVPAPDADELPAVLEHRFTQVRRAAGALDQLFAQFLRCRLTSRWSKQRAAISRWAGATRAGKNANLRLITG